MREKKTIPIMINNNHTFSTEYKRVPPLVSKHLKRDFQTPMQRSIEFLDDIICDMLYHCSGTFPGFLNGVSSLHSQG